ncbi:MAG: TolC family protein [Bacteroidales bacterium]
MKKLFTVTILLIAFVFRIEAQKSVSLGDCYTQAIRKSSLTAEADDYAKISRLNDENLKKGWLPSIDAGANAVYNSNVVDLSKKLGAINPALAGLISPMPHDQYKLTVDINQVIYDGGAIKSGRAVEKADLEINKKQTEADLYKLREQVNTYFFNILLLDRQKEIISKYIDLIAKRISSLQAAADNGMALRSDIDVMTAEKLRLKQQLSENIIRRASMIKVLSEITGNPIDSSAVFILPEVAEQQSAELKRPELSLFDLRKDKLNAVLQLEQSKRMPKAFGFATLGYGKPAGQDFFSESFGTYYMVGGGIKWNIFDWNRVKNQKEIINIQQGMIDNRKKDLEDNLNRMLDSKKAEIESYSLLLQTDNELVTLRKKVTATSESQYRNGSITATEYLNELNNEQQAIINSEIHRINLCLARVQYINISGNEIK